MRKIVIISLGIFLILNFTLKGENIREKLLNDENLLFFVPFDFSVDAETANHHKEGKLYGEGKYIEGVVNNCISLPESGKGNILYDIRDNINMKKGTIMFWFKPYWWGDTKEGKYTLLWIKMKDPNKFFAFHRSFSKEHPTLLYITANWQGGLNFYTDDVLKKNEWVHIAVTWDAGINKIILYINGKLKSTGNWKDLSEDESYTPFSLSLGKYYPVDSPINACYDEFYIFGRPLSEEEISSYYKETKK